MNATPSDLVASLLVDNSLAAVPALNAVWPVYVGRMPDTEDTAIQINDSAGDSTDGKDMRAKERIVHFGLQVLLRVPRDKYGQGMVKGGIIFRYMEEAKRVTVTITDYDVPTTLRTYRVDAISCPTGVRYIGAGEDDERHHFAFDAFLTAKEVI